MIRKFLHLFGIHWWYRYRNKRSCRLCSRTQKLICIAYNESLGIYSDYEWRDI